MTKALALAAPAPGSGDGGNSPACGRAAMPEAQADWKASFHGSGGFPALRRGYRGGQGPF